MVEQREEGYGVELVRQADGRHYLAIGNGFPLLFHRRLDACKFRDELMRHIGYKGRVVKVTAAFTWEGKTDG